MKIVVLGDNGQLARSLKKTQKNNFDVTYLSHGEAPFENFEVVKSKLVSLKPTYVINAVAYTKVDLAEAERDLCYLINYETPVKIAKWCKENQCVFIHFSTDYVFNGENEVAWNENDSTEPLNVYGMSKMRSEKEIIALGNSYIFRTSWVYSEFGQNFVKTMLNLFQSREELNIVSDQIGAPNYATDLASSVWEVLDKKPKLGLYHLSAPNFCSWYEFSLKINEFAKELGFSSKIKRINPILSKDYKAQALRPLNSRLDSTKIYNEIGLRLPEWQVSLKKCLEEVLKK